MLKEDISQVYEIDREAFPTQWPPPNFAHELQNRMAHYLVVCDASRPLPDHPGKSRHWRFLGRVFGARTAPAVAPARHYITGYIGFWLMADEAHITSIAVRQSYRGRGLGELLLIAGIERSRQLGSTVVTLEVRISNASAQSLYRKYCFAQVGVRRAYYVDNREDALLMTTPNISSAEFSANLLKLKKAIGPRLGTDFSPAVYNLDA